MFKHFGGAIGALFVASSFVAVGYLWRGFDDQTVITQLIERVRMARIDERVQCAVLTQKMDDSRAAHDLMCATQVQTLIDLIRKH